MTERPTDPPQITAAPLTVAVSLAGVQGVVLLLLAVLEMANVNSSRLEFGISTAVFFGAYGLVLLAAALALWRRSSWARGPVLITQLILLGLAWNLRDHLVVALGLAVVGLVVIAAMIHPDTITALEEDPAPASDGD